MWARISTILALVLAGLLVSTSTTMASSGASGLAQVSLRSTYTSLLAQEQPEPLRVTHPMGQAGSAAAATCTEPACPLTYQGGPVQGTVKLYLLLWGPNWSSSGSDYQYLKSFYSGLGQEPADDWSTTMVQYGAAGGQPSFHGSVLQGVFQDTTTPPTGVTATQLAALADSFYTAQKLTDRVDTQIVIATQAGTCPDGFYDPNCGGTGTYCAWHSYTSVNQVSFTNLPYLADSGGGCGPNAVNSGPSGIFDGFSIVGGHEYAESLTDPFISAWYDPNDDTGDGGGEIADKCAWRDLQDDTFATGTFAMQPLWSNSADACVQSTTITAGTPGAVSAQMRTGSNLSTGTPATIPYQLSWYAGSCPSGATYTVTESINGGAPTTIATTTSGLAYADLPSGDQYTFSVTCGGAASTVKLSVGSAQETAATYTGKWTSTSFTGAWGGKAKYSTAKNASASYTCTGCDAIAWVTDEDANHGAAEVFIDGKVVAASLNTHSATSNNRLIVFSDTFLKDGKHTIKIVNLGTKTHNRVTIDGFLTQS